MSINKKTAIIIFEYVLIFICGLINGNLACIVLYPIILMLMIKNNEESLLFFTIFSAFQNILLVLAANVFNETSTTFFLYPRK